MKNEMNDNISESEKQGYLAGEAFDEDEAKCAAHGVSGGDLERARRIKAAGRREGVTAEMALRQVATDYLRDAVAYALKCIKRQHLTMAQPCDINSIATSLRYSVDNVLQVLEMIPPLSPEQAHAAWERRADLMDK